MTHPASDPRAAQAASALLALALLCASPPAGATDPPPAAPAPTQRSSDPLASKEEAWGGSGFRLTTGLGYAFSAAEQGSAEMFSAAAVVSAGWRFDARWALMLTLRYALAHNGFTGLRWSGMVEPVVYLTQGWWISLGVGFAGLSGHRDGRRRDYDYAAYIADPAVIDLSGETRAAPPPFPACEGDGLIVAVRSGYLFTVGDLFATGPSLQLDAQWTSCLDGGFAALLPVEKRHLQPHQGWGHYSLELAWVVAWR